MSHPADYALGKGIKLAVLNPTVEIEKATKVVDKAVKDAQKAAEKAVEAAVVAETKEAE